MINRDALEMIDVFVFLLIHTVPGQENVDSVRARLEDLPEVRELADTLGGWDLLVKIEVDKKERAGAFVKKHVLGKDVLETRSLFAVGMRDNEKEE